MTVSAEWLAAATALFAAVIGPLVTIYATSKQSQTAQALAREQINSAAAQGIGSTRQQWIDNVRDTLAELLSIANQLRYISIRDRDLTWADHEGMPRVLFLQSKLELLMNPQEEDHRNLVIMVNELVSLIGVAQTASGRRSGSSPGDDGGCGSPGRPPVRPSPSPRPSARRSARSSARRSGPVAAPRRRSAPRALRCRCRSAGRSG